ncbi:hypothetical protein [Viscerimonas tarda]
MTDKEKKFVEKLTNKTSERRINWEERSEDSFQTILPSGFITIEKIEDIVEGVGFELSIFNTLGNNPVIFCAFSNSLNEAYTALSSLYNLVIISTYEESPTLVDIENDLDSLR